MKYRRQERDTTDNKDIKVQLFLSYTFYIFNHVHLMPNIVNGFVFVINLCLLHTCIFL